MSFFTDSLVKKLFWLLFLFGGLIVAVYAFFIFKDTALSPSEVMVPIKYMALALGVFLIYFLLAVWIYFLRPLRIVLSEMQALIAGKDYKRIYTSRVDEIGVLAFFFNQVTQGVGQISDEIKDRARMLDELTVAAELQRDILPLTTNSAPGLDISAKNRPATEVGGDSFNVFTVKDKTYIYIGDVTGHGVAAGLMMTMANSLMSVFAETAESPYEIVVNVNRYLKKHVKRAMFMTMVVLCWDHKKQVMTYVGAGHEHILVYRAETGLCESILSGGIALGMLPDNSKNVSEKEIPLAEGDMILLYSDGLTEARNIKEELFGLDRIISSFREHAPNYGASGVNYHVAKDVSMFMAGHKQDDDMTLIVLQRNSKLSSVQNVLATNWDNVSN